jgi:SAM-dependent methyltransferase
MWSFTSSARASSGDQSWSSRPVLGGCFGRLPRAGFAIVGIDLSAEMLAAAQAKGAREPLVVRDRVRLYQMDMTSFQLNDSFRLAMIPFRAFHHLTTPADQRRSLDCIHRSLVAGGHLVLDLFDPLLDRCVPNAPPPMPERRVTDEKTGHTAVRRVLERINDPVQQSFRERLSLENLDSDGQTIASQETDWTLRWSTRQEMRYLFELTGFEAIAEYSDFFRSPPTYGKEQLWVLRKI